MHYCCRILCIPNCHFLCIATFRLHRYLLFAQKVIHGTIGINAAKDKQVGDPFYGKVFGNLLIPFFIYWGKLECIVSSAKTARVKQIIGFFQNLKYLLLTSTVLDNLIKYADSSSLRPTKIKIAA